MMRNNEHRSDQERAKKPAPLPEMDPLLSDEDRIWLEDFRSYLHQNFADPDLSLPRIAEHFAMSESTLLRQTKRLTGNTPVQYMQEIRLTQARTLLEQRVYNSISRVALETGYRDIRSFSRAFKRKFGRLPSEW